LIRRTTAAEAVLQVLPDLHILPSGPTPPNPLEILRAPRLRMIMDEFHDRFDAFIVDTCATMISSDAQMVAHQVEDVIVVGRKDQTTLAQMNGVLSDMRIAGANILGTVFNAFDDRQTDPLVKASRSVFGRLKHLLERFKRKRYAANQFDRDL
jgi:Mrp family chromosome partitioning ATPase